MRPFAADAAAIPATVAHKGWRSIQVPSPLVNPSGRIPRSGPRLRVLTGAGPRFSAPGLASPRDSGSAASVHRHRGILWKTLRAASSHRVGNRPPCGVDSLVDRWQRSERRSALDGSRGGAAARRLCRSTGVRGSPSRLFLNPGPAPSRPIDATWVKAPLPARTYPLAKTLRDPSDRAQEKPIFPIFNRKSGLCGLYVPPFFTFSTPVDSSVDKHEFPPVKRPS